MNLRLLLLLAILIVVAAAGVYYGTDSSTPPPAPAFVAVTPTPVPSPSAPRLIGRSRMAVVSMKRLFEAHPKYKPFHNILEEKRGMALREWEHLKDAGDTDGMRRLRDTREKESNEDRDRLRKEIAADLQQRVSAFASKHDLSFVFDISGQSLNGVPVVMNAAGLRDVTDEIIKEMHQ